MAVTKKEYWTSGKWSVESQDGSIVGINYEGRGVLCFSSNKEAETLAEALAAGAGFDMNSHASAVRTLERMGYTHEGGELWKPPLGEEPDWDLVRELGNKLKVMAAMFAEYGKKEPSLRSLCKYCKRAGSCVAVEGSHCPEFLPTGWPYDE